jgi:hypothetical protein
MKKYIYKIHLDPEPEGGFTVTDDGASFLFPQAFPFLTRRKAKADG